MWFNIYYPNISLQEKLFLLLRWISAPFVQMEKRIAKKGDILDVGCGHGLFDIFLAHKSSRRKVIGIDPDRDKIRFAKKHNPPTKRVSFRHGYLENLPIRDKFDSIVLIDVDYLLPHMKKKKLLLAVRRLLKKKGQIILKTNNRSNSFGFMLCYLQEIIAVKLIGFTYSQDRGLYFYTIDQYRSLFDECNLTLVESTRLDTLLFHPHYLFVLKKGR